MNHRSAGVFSARAFEESKRQIGDIDASFLGTASRFGFGVSVLVDPAAARTPRGRGTFGWGGAYGTAFWVDPRNANRQSIDTLSSTGSQAFSTPAGWEDALLILESTTP